MDTQEIKLLRDIRVSYRAAWDALALENDRKSAAKHIRKAMSLSTDLLFEMGKHERDNRSGDLPKPDPVDMVKK